MAKKKNSDENIEGIFFQTLAIDGLKTFALNLILLTNNAEINISNFFCITGRHLLF